MITVNVKLFAVIRDLIGKEQHVLRLEEHASAEEAITMLIREYPKLEDYRRSLLIAVNCEYVPGGHTLRDGDELACIPPVSGG